jgi:hypothetical protein
MPNYKDASIHIDASDNLRAKAKRTRNSSSAINADFGLNRDDTDKDTITIRLCLSDSD